MTSRRGHAPVRTGMAIATEEDIRAEWDRVVRTIHGAAFRPAASNHACLDLAEAYASFELAEQPAVDPILVEWLEDVDRDRRYEALFLIAEHKIIWALPALRDLAARLLDSPDPAARADHEAVIRTMEVMLPS